MIKTQKIGFDFDGVFISHPPFIPKALIEKLYKKNSNQLSYRYPGKLEQKIRILSHFPMLRPAIKENLMAFKKYGAPSAILISSRFCFLKSRTYQWDQRNDLFKYFRKTYFNDKNEQPHKFKDRLIKHENLNKFIDDDLDLLLFLSKQNPKVDFYWLSNSHTTKLPINITHIKTLQDFFEKYV